MIVLKDIETKTFDKAFVGGYSPAEVDDFLDEIYDSFKKLSDDKADLEEKIVILAKKLEEYRNDEENIKNALLDAQKLKASVKEEIEKQNSELLDGAKAEAERIINDAKIEAEKILSSASVSAAKEKEILNKNISLEEKRYEEIKNTVHDFKKQIFDLYKEHLELLNSLPDIEEESYIIEDKIEEEIPEKIISEEEVSPEEDVVEEIIEENDVAEESDYEKSEESSFEKDEQISLISDEFYAEKAYKDEIKVENIKFGVDYDIEEDDDDEDEYIN